VEGTGLPVASPAVPDPRDHAEAARIAAAAGELLVGLRGRLSDDGVDAATLKDEGDRQANDLILAALAERFPDDAVLSEEAKDDQARLDAERVWIVDPLDGTREFSEPPRVDWAVHVALVEGTVPVAGAVALPGRGLVLGTDPPTTLADRRPGPPRVVVSRTRPPDIALAVADALDGELVELGSAGAKAMAVVLGEVDVYVHAGGQHEWDSCAPVAVAQAAGVHTSRIDGSPLAYNQPDPYLPDLLICRPEHAEAVLDVLR
jgi:3'(2'), 5'-bisphosphate nucleotidase